ncbi:hypothetical protein H7F37_13375 [Winogradskyella sp. PAMC22761]|nr:hypothetical protein H7F37_13375 [Winogradskyella sp. PAMC22761]
MKNIFYIICIAIFTFSCSEESHELNTSAEISNTKTFEDYIAFNYADVDNKITVQRMGALNTTASINTISTTSKIGAIELELDGTPFKGDNIYYGKNATNWTNNVEDLSMFYGKEVTIDLSNNSLQAKNGSSSNSVSFYIPDIIVANLYNLNEGRIQSGSYITWNSDSENANGITLAVEYKPMSQTDEDMYNDYSERLIKAITVDDIGSYTITDADLAEFPDDANLTFYVGRVGYVLETGSEGSNDVYVAAITSMRADMRIDKN